ncbi:FHA domain-containing protein, partial [Eubacterium aggregans]|uniref:FHA domain-containing protein n=1 Tax=Eubacterium aggregans TaxID=81409 RepID=UPI003F40C88D
GKNRFSLKQLFRSNSKKAKQNEMEEFFAGGETALIEDIYIPQIALLAISGVKADFLINKVEFILGSSSHCDGRIQDIPGVSRSHFRILEHDGQEFIQDLGSRNGTFLNGKRLDRQAYPVYPGDIIHIAADVKLEVKEYQ